MTDKQRREIERHRKRWQANILAFCDDVLYHRTPEGVKKWQPYPEQAEALAEATRRKPDGTPVHRTAVFSWPKRDGKSTAAAALLAADLACGEGTHSVVVSNSREMAQTVTYEALLNFIRNSPILAALVPPEARLTNRLDCVIYDNWVRTLPAKVETVQGLAVTGHAVFDDAHSAPLNLLDMVASQTESKFAQVFVPSMMGSTCGYVYRLWERHKSGEGAGWLHFDYRTHNANPAVTAEWLAARRAELPPPMYAILHENQPGEGASNLFDLDSLERCRRVYQAPTTAYEWEEWCLAELGVNAEAVRIGYGLDRAQPGASGDDSVASLVGKVRRMNDREWYFVLHADGIPGSGEAAIIEHAKRMHEVYGSSIRRGICEAYQAADLAPKIQQALQCPVELRHATVPAQVAMFQRMWSTVNEGRFVYPAGHPMLHSQLARFTIDTSDKNPRFSGGPGKAVDDFTYATAWALEAAAQAKAPDTLTSIQWDFSRAPVHTRRGGDLGHDVPPKLFCPGGEEEWVKLMSEAYRQEGMVWHPPYKTK